MAIWYKNSFLASAVSIIGSALGISGIKAIVGGHFAPGITLVIAAVPLLILGRYISNRKSFNTWWKVVADAGLEPQIAQSYSVALRVYRKNPCKRTLKKIAKLNPDAAEAIRQQLADKKSV